MAVRPSSVALILYALSIVVLFFVLSSQAYTEWLQASIARKYDPLRRYTPVPCEPNPDNHGKVVHIDCPIENMVLFYPPQSFNWNVRPTKGLFFDTKVEMYQWAQTHQRLGLTCSKRWSENKEVGSSGWITSRENPDYWPAVSGHGRAFPPKFYAGGFELDPAVISTFSSSKQLDLMSDDYFESSPVRPPQFISSRNTKTYDNYLYTGDPTHPVVGDMRVSFYTSSATHVSAVGQQMCRHGKCYIVPVTDSIIDRGNTRAWALKESEIDPDDRFAQAINVAKQTFDWMATKSASLVVRSPRIKSLDDELIIVREGDHSGYKLLHDAVSGGKKQKGKRWSLRFSTFILTAIIAAWSYGIFHPNKGFHRDLPSYLQIFWLGVGGMGAGVFVTGAVASVVWFITDIWMGLLLMFAAVLGLILALYVGEYILESESSVHHSRNYPYTAMKDEPIHGTPPPSQRVPLNISIGQDERSESSFYSPL